jgi:hypothetical protein
LRSLWRALALAVAWLGGIASPMLTDDAMSLDRPAEERPAAAKSAVSADGTSLPQPPARNGRSEIT